ncbi:hypothetical protein GCM10007390_31290 [Persicitalea jodogahamensis]|uniref:Uncharacterized protein n=1 Tax=Persicitalea jodogahamensis TaxID=402147 RepID=A0A8J3D388_9BACT|nr:hypothetical protein GCM10007390_31290 [Persicitalea jodogahamensis]
MWQVKELLRKIKPSTSVRPLNGSQDYFIGFHNYTLSKKVHLNKISVKGEGLDVVQEHGKIKVNQTHK